MNLKKYNLLYIALVFLLFFFLNVLRFFFETNNYFDHAIYNNLILNSLNENYWMLFFGHFQILIALFSFFFSFLESNLFLNILIIFIKNLIIISPLFFLYNKKFILLFSLSLSFIIWYNMLNSFHPSWWWTSL